MTALIVALAITAMVATPSSALAQNSQSDGKCLDLGLDSIVFGSSHFPDNSRCGARSVCAVLHDLGEPIDYETVLREMPPGIYGSTMDQIDQYIRDRDGVSSFPVKCSARQLWKTLRGSERRMAIANVSSHWVVARSAKADRLEILDYPHRYFIPLGVFERHFDGHAILVGEIGSPFSRIPLAAKVMGGLGLFALAATALTVWQRLSRRSRRVQ